MFVIIGIVLAILLIIILFINLPSKSSDDALSDSYTQTTEIQSEIISSKAVDSSPSVVSSRVLYLVFSSFLISLTSLVLILFMLFKRKILVDNQVYLMPNYWGTKIQHLEKSFTRLNDSINFSEHSNRSLNRETTDAIQNIKSIIEEYLHHLNQKDKEIRAYREGYNSYLYDRFLIRFIRIDRELDAIEKIANTEPIDLVKDIAHLKKMMEYALFECGVESYSPAVGENYNSAKGVAENPEIVETEKEEEDFLIAKIIQPGYMQSTGDIQKPIFPAKVAIYKKDKGD